MELDKIDLSDLLNAPGTEKKTQKGTEKKARFKIPSLNIMNVKIALIIGAMVLSITFVSLLWDQKIVNLPFVERTPTPQMSARIVTVGPVLTSYGKDEHIKMTVQIECKNARLKEQVAGQKQRIRSKIMLMLNDPKAKRLLRQGDFKALKPLMRKEVERLISNTGIQDIYFSQINLY